GLLHPVAGGLTRRPRFQSPRSWGVVGLPPRSFASGCLTSRSFNPLGVGAWSGSLGMEIRLGEFHSLFQSPRSWGVVGLLNWLSCMADSHDGFNPLGVGAWSGSAVAATTGPT